MAALHITQRKLFYYALIFITTIVIYDTVYSQQKSVGEIEKSQAIEKLNPTQNVLDRYGDYVFDKNYVLHFPSGETLAFEKGVDGVNDFPLGKFSPDGRYIVYTYGDIQSQGGRRYDIIIYDISNRKSKKISGTHQLIKDIHWFTYREKLYLIYNTLPGKYDNVWLYIIDVENARKVVQKLWWSFVHFWPSGDGFRYDLVQQSMRFEDLLLFDVLMIPPEKAEKIISSRATEVILALKNKDMEKLSFFIHPIKGVRFSPYAYVHLNRDLVFTADEIQNLYKDETKFWWGEYDGSGDLIKLSFKEYFDDFVYDEDFTNAREIGYNRIIGTGNTLNNNFETYPGSIIVEYHFPGFDPKYGGMDWSSLRLVFEEKDSVWYLVGIIHDQWTI